MIYWTKPIFETREDGLTVKTDKFEEIKECADGYVPDGDGFEVDLNGIKYKTYLKSPDKYTLDGNKLIEISK